MDNRIIGKFIKKKRKEIGLTQIELGDKLVIKLLVNGKLVIHYLILGY